MDIFDPVPVPAPIPAERQWQIRIYEENPDSDHALRRIRWCMHDSSVLAQLANMPKGAQLHVMLVVVHEETRKEVRYFVSAEYREQVVRVRRGGAFRAYARLVLSANAEEESNARRYCMRESYYGGISYDYSLLSRPNVSDGKPQGGWVMNCDVYAAHLDPVAASYAFKVSTEHFAPPKSAALTAWVNAWHKLSQADECSWRRRLIFAFTIQPLLTLLWFAFALALASFFGIICARRGVDWKMLHPVRGSLDYIASSAKNVGTLFTKTAAGKRRFGAYPLVLATPLIQMAIAAAVILVMALVKSLAQQHIGIKEHLISVATSWRWLDLYVAINVVAWLIVPAFYGALKLFAFVGGVLAMLFGSSAVYLIDLIAERIPKPAPASTPDAAEQAAARAARAQEVNAKFGGLVCTTGEGWTQEPSFYEAPKVWARLKCNRAKAAFCRPFAEHE